MLQAAPFNPREIRIADFTYQLPAGRIAAHPLRQRDQSRLLVYRNGLIRDDVFSNLPDHLPPGTLLVVNDTRVIEARIFFSKPTGGMIEIFCLEPFEQTIEETMQQRFSAEWKCLIGGASKWKPGQVLHKALRVNDSEVVLQATFRGRLEDSFRILFEWNDEHTFSEVLHAAGAIPLPPYIHREAELEDADRYQTIFGIHEGSVAAPTAALHFTPEVFDRLRNKGIHTEKITLHVGAGTFKPVKSEQIGGHHMHTEPFSVTKATLEHLASSERIAAVGTTSLRTLESLYWLGIRLKFLHDTSFELGQWDAYELDSQYGKTGFSESCRWLIQWMEQKSIEEIHCRTGIIIVPGYTCRTASALITNFHQPQSTLLLLVAAFAGKDWKKIYNHALEHDYRFLSYGDSSLLWKAGDNKNPSG
ncbi:MAG TPA: S-adenosylmethionine:tRNA ribosyltransferase-isomerase [Flavisolibacter sp.]